MGQSSGGDLQSMMQPAYQPVASRSAHRVRGQQANTAFGYQPTAGRDAMAALPPVASLGSPVASQNGAIVSQRRARRSVSQPAMASLTMGGAGSSLVAEARHWIGGNPTGRASLWCGHFMNFVLERTGHHRSPSNTARSFASYGHRISGPQVGAIAVMSRGRSGGHVGVVSGIDSSGNPIIISGNHGHRVAEAVYPRSRIFAYVMP